MSDNIFVGLINNAALLLALGLIIISSGFGEDDIGSKIPSKEIAGIS